MAAGTNDTQGEGGANKSNLNSRSRGMADRGQWWWWRKVNGDTDRDGLAAGRRDEKRCAQERLLNEFERCKQCWDLKKLVVTSLQS